MIALTLVTRGRRLQLSTVAKLGSEDARQCVRLQRAILDALKSIDPTRRVTHGASRVVEWSLAVVGLSLAAFGGVQLARVALSAHSTTFGYGIWSVVALLGLGLIMLVSPWTAPKTSSLDEVLANLPT